MPRIFFVRPRGGGWSVQSEGLLLEFSSGARAEAWARRVAQDHAATGVSAEVRIMLRDGGLAGVSLYKKGSVLIPA